MQIRYATVDGSATPRQATTRRWGNPAGTLNIAPDPEQRAVQHRRQRRRDTRRCSGDPKAENFFVDLISATGGATIGTAPSRGTGQINDDDTPPAVASISSPTVTEGNSTVQAQWVKANFVVRLSANAPTAVTINYSTEQGSATGSQPTTSPPRTSPDHSCWAN